MKYIAKFYYVEDGTAKGTYNVYKADPWSYTFEQVNDDVLYSIAEVYRFCARLGDIEKCIT